MSVLKGLGMIALAVSLTACAGNSADVGASFASETVDIYREIKVLLIFVFKHFIIIQKKCM